MPYNQEIPSNQEKKPKEKRKPTQLHLKRTRGPSSRSSSLSPFISHNNTSYSITPSVPDYVSNIIPQPSLHGTQNTQTNIKFVQYKPVRKTNSEYNNKTNMDLDPVTKSYSSPLSSLGAVNGQGLGEKVSDREALLPVNSQSDILLPVDKTNFENNNKPNIDMGLEPVAKSYFEEHSNLNQELNFPHPILTSSYNGQWWSLYKPENLNKPSLPISKSISANNDNRCLQPVTKSNSENFSSPLSFLSEVCNLETLTGKTITPNVVDTRSQRLFKPAKAVPSINERAKCVHQCLPTYIDLTNSDDEDSFSERSFK